MVSLTVNFSDLEWREIFKNRLREEEVSVVFTKKDGSKRTMLCTLVESKIPEDKRPKKVELKEGEKPRVLSDDVARVFDLEKSEWRSFRWDSISEVR